MHDLFLLNEIWEGRCFVQGWAHSQCTVNVSDSESCGEVEMGARNGNVSLGLTWYLGEPRPRKKGGPKHLLI